MSEEEKKPKTNRRKCFGIRDEWYTCMRENVSELFLYNEEGLKCKLGDDCEKQIYQTAHNSCQVTG
jgi:hypothetical protein